MQLYFNYPGVLIWTFGRIFGKGARDNGRGKEKKNDGTLSRSLAIRNTSLSRVTLVMKTTGVGQGIALLQGK